MPALVPAPAIPELPIRASATRAAMVVSKLLERADARAGDLAKAYDRSRIAGQACERANLYLGLESLRRDTYSASYLVPEQISYRQMKSLSQLIVWVHSLSVAY